MFIVESFYNLKKKITKFWCDYFTVEGEYTSLLPDKIYLKKLYKKRLGKELNLKKPEGFTEKLNWLKLYNRRPEYTIMADKYAVRKFISDKIGEEYLIPLIGYWNSPDEIDFSLLPDKFVLKCNHDNGVIICKDKSTLDVDKTKKELSLHLSRDYYKKRREWVYKNIPRKIVCEAYIKDDTCNDLIDYKFYCFDGKVKLVLVATERATSVKFNYFDKDFKPVSFTQGYQKSERKIYKPKNYETMVLLAEKLSMGIPHVRVDFYNIEGKIYFGEMTFFDGAGFEMFEPPQWEKKIGDWITLPKKI